MSSFWLSHHPAHELDRTYEIGSAWICARCLGTYPLLIAALCWQFARHVPLAWRFDGLWSVGLLLPALADWAYACFRPHAGSNLWRTGTGLLLGLALARTLYIHFQRPLPFWLLVQAGLVTAVALPVMVLRRPKRSLGR
jgi:uncharacterized membrane protein